MKILILDDHTFYSNEIKEDLEEAGHNVFYAKSYKIAEDILKTEKQFDVSLLDIILQNGKTGFLFSENYGKSLGRIMFVTGCVDDATLASLKQSPHASASKGFPIWDKLSDFLKGGVPRIV